MLEVQIRKKLAHYALEVEWTMENEIVVLFGPSGSGKTTILNCIAGLDRPDSGSIRLNHQLYFNEKWNLATKKRNIGYLFQDYALFPHMTVEKNIRYGRKKKNDADASDKRIHQLVDALKIEHLLNKYPKQISGGEKQRVALARALATEPDLLLLDEPLSALDEQTREECQDELLRLHRSWNIPFILVTHDSQEARKLGDRILFLEQGKIVKSEPAFTT